MKCGLLLLRAGFAWIAVGIYIATQILLLRALNTRGQALLLGVAVDASPLVLVLVACALRPSRPDRKLALFHLGRKCREDSRDANLCGDRSLQREQPRQDRSGGRVSADLQPLGVRATGGAAAEP